MNARAKTRLRAGKMGKASKDYKVTALSFRFVRPLKSQARPFPSPKWTQTPQQLQCGGKCCDSPPDLSVEEESGIGRKGSSGDRSKTT